MSRLRLAICGLLVIALFALLTAVTVAQSGGGYDLTWNTVDSGGYTFSMGGGYSLGGTIGQTDAGVLSGGSYTLVGGFWGGAEAHYRVFLPLVMRSS